MKNIHDDGSGEGEREGKSHKPFQTVPSVQRPVSVFS